MRKFKNGKWLVLLLGFIVPTLMGGTFVLAEDSASNTITSTNVTAPSKETETTKTSEATTETSTTESSSPTEESGNKEESKVIHMQLLGVNDFHGALDTTGTAYFPDSTIRNVGRASVLAAYLKKAEKSFATNFGENSPTELVQAGDMVGASPANSALLRDEPTIKVFNRMGFTIGTLGNHEFDKGLGEFMRILNGEAPNRANMGTISDTLWNTIETYPREKSNQQIVIANVKNKEDGLAGKKGEQPYNLPPYLIKEYGEGENKVKVGYIGVVTKEFPNLVLAKYSKDFEVMDEGEAIAKYSKELREDQHVSAIVVISHVAATSNGDTAMGDVVDMMKTVEEEDPDNNVDLVFAGHNHQYTNGVIKRDNKNDVRVVQSTSQGKAYIDVQAELDVDTKEFKETPKAEIIATEPSQVEADQDVQEIVNDASNRILSITNESVGHADLDKVTDKTMISRSTNENDESELGNLITDSQLYMANNSDLTDNNGNSVKADFAITNTGGIRADLAINDKGEITWGAAQTVQPFGNILQVVSMTGKDVKEALNQQYNNGKTGYSLQISGLSYTYKGSAKDADGSFEIVNAKLSDGTLIKDDSSYNVIINDFLFGGGDGFSAFKKGNLVTALETDTDTFVNYFKTLDAKNEKISSPKLDRKQMENSPGDYISDGRYVKVVKKGVEVFSSFDWAIKAKSDDLMTMSYQARGRYEHSNGTTYLSLYDNKGKWQGYIDEKATSKVEGQGDYISDGRYVTIKSKNYDVWSSFSWEKRDSSSNLYQKTFQAKGIYNHFNGATYLSLYDVNGKWFGYVNQNAVDFGDGKNGAYIPDGQYVTVVKDNYDVWSNFNWKHRTTSKQLYHETYQAKGKYNHINGATYYSLYNDKGVWQGYINANATKKGEGKQGAYISYGKKVKIAKKGYNTWSDFKWTERYKTDNMIGYEYTARGQYFHSNGATYYSLYDNDGNWHGYINKNAVK